MEGIGGQNRSPGPDPVSGAQRPTEGTAPGSPRRKAPIHPAASTAVYKRIIIEICCGKDSQIGRKTQAYKDCLVIRITMDDDFATEK